MAKADLVLALWEAAEAGPPHGRAARLLGAAGEPDPGSLPLGAAAHRLLALRTGLLGERMTGVATCPACGEVNEAPLDAAALAACPAEEAPVRVEVHGWSAAARRPTLADLDAARRCPDVATAATLLRDKVLLAVEPPAGAARGAAPPEALFATLEEALDAADGMADARVAGACAGCGNPWEVAFDAASFFAAELGVQARRSLSEVATLARAFGWSEAAILALPAARRRAYLDLVG